MEEQLALIVSYLRAIWKHRWYAIITAWTISIVGGLVVLLMPPKFQASARVFVDTQSIVKPLLSNMTTVPNLEQQVAIMSRTLLSRPNMERLVRMTELDVKANTAKSQEETINKLMNE